MLLAVITITCLLAVLASLAALHFLRLDLDPGPSHLSYYAVGRYSWLMTLSFLLASVGTAALAAALWRRIAGSAALSWGCTALLLASITYVALALFVTDVRSLSEVEPTRTIHGQVHDLAAKVHGLAWLLAAAVFPFALGRDERWKQLRSWSAVGSVAIAATIAVRVFSPPAWEGVTQRLWISVVLVWALGHAVAARRNPDAAAVP
jgi:hypothetical protein